MTWRELIRQLETYSDNILDMDARVWLHCDVDYPDGEVNIIGVSAFDGELPAGIDNMLSLDLSENRIESDWLTRDRDFYCIEEMDGQKVIHYEGCTYLHDNGSIVLNEMTFCYVPVHEYSKNRLDDAAVAVQQYSYIAIDDVSDLYKNYFSDGRPTYLPLKKVTEETPCGNYWCFVDDE